MRNLLLKIKYNGAGYHGWQIQQNAITVQEVFQNAVRKVFEKDTEIKGCSRTDSKVHANMYCVSFKTEKEIDNESVIRAVNTYLPNDVAVFSCEEVPDDFHARYSVKSKEYVYMLYNGKIRNPFYNDFAFQYRYDIDEKYLDKEAKAFIGTYDFSGFCSANSGVEDTIRTVKSFDVFRRGDMVYFKVEADGFLYNMVRIMVGTLLFISEGKIESGKLKNIIISKNRKMAGKTAPPQGLYLNKVNY